MQLVFWFLTPVLGFLSIIGSRAFGGLNVFEASSYDGTVSHFYFISFSVLVVAVAEIVELAFHTDRAVKGKAYGTAIALQLVIGLVFLACVGAIYFMSTQADLSGTGKFTKSSFSTILITIFSSSALGLLVRAQLESVRS